MIPGAFHSLHAAKEHRKQIRAMANGTILQWISGHGGITLSSTIKAGSYTKIVELTDGVAPLDNTEASKVYKLILCTKTGKEYTKTIFWNVASIDAKISNGEIVIANGS